MNLGHLSLLSIMIIIEGCRTRSSLLIFIRCQHVILIQQQMKFSENEELRNWRMQEKVLIFNQINWPNPLETGGV